MGGAVSSGRDNNELVDNLMGGGYIRTRSIERVFRVLDRADYMTPNERDQAYKDLAWRSGALHLSAPCIYSEVMEALELKPGLSFLNLGSGTGYLSTLVGLVIGSAGISHGVEIHPGVVEYSTKKLSQFQENSVTLDEFDFCIPKYYSGNALCLAPLQSQYDRVYVGAGVLPKYENYFKQLIKVNGVLVMPLGDTLVQMRRVSDTEWSSRQLLNVSFALMRAPTKEESAEPIKMEELVPVPLMLLCRAAVRGAMHAGVVRRHPELREPAPRRAPAPRPRSRRICIPIEPDSDDASLNELHGLRGAEGGREMNALLSLVLSMGNNRVAGSLRLPDERPRPRRAAPAPPSLGQGELEVVIDEVERGSSESSGDGAEFRESSREPAAPAPPAPGPRRSPRAPPPPPARPSAAGTAGATDASTTVDPVSRSRVSRGGWAVPARAGAGAGRGVARAPGEAAPGATASGTDLDALNPAGRVEVDDAEVSDDARPTVTPDPPTEHAAPAGDDSKPSTSGTSPAAARAAPGSGSSSDSGAGAGTKRGGSGGARRRGRAPAPAAGPPAARSKRFPHEVQIYFGNAGVYDGSDVVREAEEDAATASEDVDMDGSGSDSDGDRPTSSKDKKRQKLDSGIGEGTASGSAGGASSQACSDGCEDGGAAHPAPADADPDADADRDGGARGPRRRSGSGSEGGAGSRRARRSTRDARRVRLSIVMKRAIKELPLPYALKKFVNLHRCFEF